MKTPIEHVEFGTEVTWNRKRYRVETPVLNRPITGAQLRNVATGQIKWLAFGTLVTIAKAKVTR